MSDCRDSDSSVPLSLSENDGRAHTMAAAQGKASNHTTRVRLLFYPLRLEWGHHNHTPNTLKS